MRYVGRLRPRRTRSALGRIFLVLPLGIALATPILPAEPAVARSAAPQPVDRPPKSALKLQQDGDHAYGRGDFAHARDLWIDAYRELPDTSPLVSYRTTLLTLIRDAALHAHEKDEAAGPIKQVIELYETFLVRHLPPDSDRRRQYEDELTQLRLRVPPEPIVPVPVATPPTAEPAPEPDRSAEIKAPEAAPTPVTPRPQVVAPPRPPRIRLALLATGSSSLAAGIGALIAGAIFKPRAEEQVVKYDDPAEREAAFVDAETKKGLVWMGIGGGLSAVGLALLISGATLRARTRDRSHANLSGVAPWLERPGIVLTGRF